MKKNIYYHSTLYENGEELCDIDDDTLDGLIKCAKKIIKDIEPEHRNPRYSLKNVKKFVDYVEPLTNIKL